MCVREMVIIQFTLCETLVVNVISLNKFLLDEFF
jgi:hypothetical protein